MPSSQDTRLAESRLHNAFGLFLSGFISHEDTGLLSILSLHRIGVSFVCETGSRRFPTIGTIGVKMKLALMNILKG